MRRLGKNAARLLFLLVSVGIVTRARPQDEASERSFEEHWQACVQGCTNLSAEPNGKLRLLTGPGPAGPDKHSGHYFKVGEAIKEVTNQGGTDLQIETIPTCQTKCNLWGLQSGHAELALVQSDVAHDVWFGHPPISTAPLKDIRLVAQLYVEAVHILVRPHLNIARLTDLRGRRAWLGPKDSFTGFTARRILEAAGLLKEEIDALENQCADPELVDDEACPKIKEMDRVEALEQLAHLKLDALFQVGALPFDAVRDTLVPKSNEAKKDPGIPAGKSTIESKVEVTTKKVCSTLQAERRVNPELKDWEIRLFELDVDLVNRLVADGSYIEQLIPADTYCQSKATLTVGVRALLLTKITDNPADRVKLTKQLARVKQLAKSLFTHPKAYERAVRAQIEIERGPDQDPITQDLGKLGLLWMATPEQFHSREIKPQANFRLAWVKAELWLLIGCIVFLLLPVCLFPRRVLPWLASRGEFFAGGLGLLALWTVAAVGMNHKEGNLNEHYANWPNSFLTTLADLTPLFGDHALTTAGQAYLAVCQKFAYVILVAILLPTGHRWLRPPLRKLRARLLELGQKPQEAASRMQSWVLSGARKIRAWLLWLLGLIQKHRPARATSAKQGRSVIINDLPERTEELAHELRNADPRAQPIVVVSQKPPQLPGKPAYQDAQFVHGEPTCEECLQRARVSEADSIRIVSAWPNPNPTDRRRFLRGDLADGRTIQAVRAIHSLCGERKGVKIVVELKLRKNRRAALEAAQGTPITIDVKDDPQSVSA